MSDTLEAQVGAVLSRLKNPRLDSDLMSAGMVRDLQVFPDGRVTFTFLLGRSDPATLVRETRAALKAIPGVTEVKIAVVDPAGSAAPTHGPPSGGAMPQSTGMPQPPSPAEYPNLGRVIAISSGKGGVGKSTVAVNLAVMLAKDGKRVGIMDADIYGPNVPRMFGVFDKPAVVGGRIQPLEAYGVKLMSIGFLVERDAAAIWRGPIIMKVLQQFLRDVEWGELDYFLVDMPPGRYSRPWRLTPCRRDCPERRAPQAAPDRPARPGPAAAGSAPAAGRRAPWRAVRRRRTRRTRSADR